MNIIPLLPIPAQRLSVVLEGQPVAIRVYSKGVHTYADVVAAGVVQFSGAIALDRTPIKQLVGGSVPGNFMFFDAAGKADPQYAGFGSRYFLIYYPGA